MKTNNLRRSLTLLAILFVAVIFSSCNRGYGCPTNFSIDTAAETMQRILSLLW